MTMGKTGLLQYAQKADWPKRYLQSLAALFFKLEAMSFANAPGAQKSLSYTEPAFALNGMKFSSMVASSTSVTSMNDFFERFQMRSKTLHRKAA
jgi:hypothetical protein